MPIAPVRSGANFCICSSPRDGARDGRRRQRNCLAEEERAGKGVRATSGIHVGDKVKQPERGMLGKRTKYIEGEKKSEMFEGTEREMGGGIQRGHEGGNGGKENNTVNLWS